MIELTSKRIEEILNEETAKQEELATILRSVYTRYMRLCEKYLADIEALNDDEIAKLRNFHEETKSLVKYYYIDIPYDICVNLDEFDRKYADKLLGEDWHEYLFDVYDEFVEENEDEDKSEDELKAEFREQNLTAFYKTMDYIFRPDLGTGSKTAANVIEGITGLLFGKKE